MPRVHTRTKTTRGKYEYTCTGCREKIEPGESYYTWTCYGSRAQHRHTKCGRPRPTELSSRKTAQIEEAITDAEQAIDNFYVELPADHAVTEDVYEIETDDLQSILEEVANVAQDVASEYESGADNMPENLQYGSQAEAMREVASNLEDWLSNMQYASFSFETVDLPNREDYEDDDAWRNDAQIAVEEAVSELQAEARALLEDMPEYEG